MPQPPKNPFATFPLTPYKCCGSTTSPGNVRELENAIERAVLYETTDQLQPQSLLLHQAQEGSQQATSSPTDATTILPLDEVERRTIVHALKVTEGNVSAAAQALGIGRNTLYRKMEEHNLRP